ncbi:hypothetical protein BJ944DRAFT_268247 [Cunninghamella echinulata]|nr:hypothetical protein BJ944DRAFT_268247 [Cunninghamella echinulata]
MRNSACIKAKWTTFKSWIIPSPIILLQQKRKQYNNKKKQQQELKEKQDHCIQQQRRPSHCTSCCSHASSLQHQKNYNNNTTTTTTTTTADDRNSYSFFKRRPSSCSEMSVADLHREAEKLYDLFLLALDELNYAGDSQGTFYYINDRVSAKEAIENFTNASMQLLNQAHDQQFKSQLQELIYPRLYLLQNKFDALPDDPKPPTTTQPYYSCL